MEIVVIQDARLLAWAAKRVGTTFAPAECKWVAGLGPGGITWVVVYSHFSDRNCAMSIATDGSRRWASRAMFAQIFGIPFVQWKFPRVTFIVAENNARSLAMLRHNGRFSIGAREEGRMRAMFADDVDGIAFGLLARECRWIREGYK